MATSRSNGGVNEIFVKFSVDYSQLEKAEDTLEKTGAIDAQLASAFRATNTEINKQAEAIKKVSATTPKLKTGLDEIAAATKKTSNEFIKSFEQGVIMELKKAGLSLEEFIQLLTKGPQLTKQPNETLKSQLRGLTEQLAALKAAGADNTEQYRKLVLEAGRLKDAIGDAQAEIRTAASDTSVFDGLISGVQGVTGAVAVAQGSIALFGEQNEELHKTLLKVNAVMAILQGLQQVQNVLQKESAAARLLDVAGTKAQIVVNKLYTFVMNGATIATKAFRAALISTGIGAIIVLIGLLINELIEFLNRTDETTKGLEKMNEQLRLTGQYASDSVDAFKKANDLIIAELEARGATEAEINEARIRGYDQQIAAAKQFYDEASENFQQYDQMRAKSEEEYGKAYLSAQEIVNDAATKYYDLVDARERARLDIIKRNNEQQKELEKKRVEDARAARLKQLEEELAALKIRLLQVKQGSEEELKLRQEIISKQADIELQAEKLGKNQRRLIREQANAEQLAIAKQFEEEVRKVALEAQIARNEAEIAQLATSNEDKLNLQVANLELQAQIEIDAANGNAAKIKEILAKRDAEIRDTKKRFIDEALQYELELTAATSGVNLRAAQRLAADEKQTLSVRVAAINEIADAELQNIGKRLAALEQEKELKLINDEDYILRYKKLLDEKAKVTEEAEVKITTVTKSEEEKRMENDIRRLQQIVAVAQQVADIIGSLNDLQTANEQQRLEADKRRVDELLEAGAITEKEAERRNKRLEAEEKRLRQLQAQREKQAAVFKALLSIPQAFLTGLTQGGPLLGAIYAGIAAVQAAIIAARKIPEFRKGKKKNAPFEGYGKIGEAGAELLEKDGRMYVAKEPTIVWLAKEDVVHTPEETRKIMQTNKKRVDKEVLSFEYKNSQLREQEYEQFAKIIAKEIGKIPGTSIQMDEHGFHISIQRGLERMHYMDKKYRRS